MSGKTVIKLTIALELIGFFMCSPLMDTTFQNVPLYPVKRGLQFRFKMCQKKVLNF